MVEPHTPARRTTTPLARLQHTLWTALATCLAPLWLAALAIVPRLRFPLRQRLGTSRRVQPGGVLFHAASAGDVRAVAAVARVLAAQRPGLPLTCTVQTRSGLEMARRLELPMHVVALPVDAWPWVDRFIAGVRPTVLVLEYLELWPRLIHCARHQGAAVVLQNGRIHPDRMARYQASTGELLREHLRALDHCTARSQDDARRLRALGVTAPVCHPHTKHALGHAPTEAEVAALLAGHGLDAPARAHTWIAGSVHADELERVLEAHRALVDTDADVRLVLCPRYPGDGARAAARAEALGLSWVRLDGSSSDASVAVTASVWIVETIGELTVWYATAAVALVGGTLGARGGQNPVEPARARCRLVVGPNTTQIATELAWLPASHRVDVSGSPDSIRDAVAALLAQPHATGEATDLVDLARRACEELAATILALHDARR